MNKCRENTVNAKTTQPSCGPTISEMRMSRLSHPRASLLTVILLAAVFLLFGLFASAVEPDYAVTPAIMNCCVPGDWALIGDWISGHTG